MKTMHLTAKGRVHGVGFRCYALDAANRLKIKGTVENTYDSADAPKAVEIYCQGREANLEKFISLMKKGPSDSRVDEFSITIEELPAIPEFRII